MAARIFPNRLPRFFLAEWRDRFDLTQKQLGERLGVSGVTVSRWETGERQPDLNVLAAIAEARGIEMGDLSRDPKQPSADELLRGQPPEIVDHAIKLIKAIRR